MAQENVSLSISIEWWQEYQDQLKEAIAPLTADQLALRLAPELRSLGEIAEHMVVARAWWWHGFMGEGGRDIEPLTSWDAPDDPPQGAAELLRGFDQTWQLMAACLARWTDADMRQTFWHKWYKRDLSRSWVVWHILEHELHHGGELSLTLGGNGLAAPDI